MSDLDLANLSITRASRALRAKELSPLELADAYLRRIEALNPRVNAYITVNVERAREEARRATEELAAGKARGPLHGIPIAHKDLYETAGIRTTGGAEDHGKPVRRDCTVVRKLREAGTVLLGKLNTHEYAYGVTTNNPHTGATHNPWDLARIPAGSSGGSGAAIAAGLATATTGTDTGGSIRMPASLCGVVGLKPTYGRVSKQGVLPLSYAFDHTGPITRTVEDAALMLNAIAGYDPADATTCTPVDDARTLSAGVRAAPAFPARGSSSARMTRCSRRSSVRSWSGAARRGAQHRAARRQQAMGGLFGFVLAEAGDPRQSLRTRRRTSALTCKRCSAARHPTPLLMTGLRARDALAAMRVALESVDVLVTPTTPIAAPRIGEETVRIGGADESVLIAMIRCTAPFNATHLPALSLPCGFTRAGLPIGLQIAGRPFDEATVLRAGHAYEQATEWHLRTPGL
jgi:aspartyl-tRNA(Asn)/glutamyl-tRNA(Gln) amidotransferase subunit A